MIAAGFFGLILWLIEGYKEYRSTLNQTPFASLSKGIYFLNWVSHHPIHPVDFLLFLQVDEYFIIGLMLKVPFCQQSSAHLIKVEGFLGSPVRVIHIRQKSPYLQPGWRYN